MNREVNSRWDRAGAVSTKNHAMRKRTNQTPMRLKIELEAYNGTKAEAYYDNFNVADEVKHDLQIIFLMCVQRVFHLSRPRITN